MTMSSLSLVAMTYITPWYNLGFKLINLEFQGSFNNSSTIDQYIIFRWDISHRKLQEWLWEKLSL